MKTAKAAIRERSEHNQRAKRVERAPDEVGERRAAPSRAVLKRLKLPKGENIYD